MAAGLVGLYILLLYFIFFDNRCYSRESAKQAPGDTIPTVGLPAELIKYLQTFDPCCPLFTGRVKWPKFWPKFRPRSSLDCRFFEKRRFIGNPKQTYQGPMILLPPHQTWGGRVPQIPEPLAQWVPQKDKSGKFLIYSPFLRPTPSTAPPMSYHLLGP